jgi:DNA-binding response OmpR family regulator
MTVDIFCEGSEGAQGSRNILIVEDENSDAALLSIHVGGLYPDYSIMSAVSVSAAYEIFKEHTFSMILLDLNLPDGHGPQTVKEVRRYNKATPIIVVTGMGTDMTVNESLKLGANDVVFKSQISDEDFRNTLNQYLLC